jgi:hypothetical protein
MTGQVRPRVAAIAGGEGSGLMRGRVVCGTRGASWVDVDDIWCGGGVAVVAWDLHEVALVAIAHDVMPLSGFASIL